MSILFSGDFHANSSGEIASITKTTLVKRYRNEKNSRVNYHFCEKEDKLSLLNDEIHNMKFITNLVCQRSKEENKMNMDKKDEQGGLMNYYNENCITENCWAFNDEIKSSLHKIPLNEFISVCGGIPLYADSEAVYVEEKDSHSLIIGSTGSKKTRLVGMPVLQTYAIAGESFIATDPKGELYKKTYKTLKDQDYRIFLLNLRNPKKSNSWNPLKIPYSLYHNGDKDKAREMVIDMANSIVITGMIREPYWEESASKLLAGLILLLFEYAKEDEINFKSLRILRTQTLKNCENNETYIQKYFFQYLEKSSFLNSLLSNTTEVCHDTRSCIVSEFDQAMTPFFSQENLIDMLSGNEIDFGEIGKTKTAVFLIIPDENTVYNKIISLFIKQCYTELIREAENHPNNRLPKRVNFLLDEFSNLPAIKDFPAMMTASRSRNIRFNLIIQAESQLIERYGNNSDTITANCDNWIFLYSHENSFMEKLITMAGKKCNKEPMISIPMLQNLSKEKGEAYLLHGRCRPFITNLLDIDRYPNIAQREDDFQYSENKNKAISYFDFYEYCSMMNNDDYRILKPNFTSKIDNSKNHNYINDYDLDEFNVIKRINEESPHNGMFVKTNIEHCYGSHGLVLPIIKEIMLFNEKNPDNEIIIENINQCDGTLHISTSLIPDYIRGMISIAEKESEHICEICGARGKLTKIGESYMTLCKHHLKAKIEAKDDDELFESLYRKETHEYENNREIK